MPTFFKLDYNGILNSFRQLSPSEPQHSRIICDLINPKNKDNKYAGLFLKLFFEIVLNDENFEYNPNDIWEVTAEIERYDIRIRNKDNSKIIIIESKSNGAEDQSNQLYRYWYFGIYKAQENVDRPYKKILYLIKPDGKGYTPQSITRPEDLNIFDLTKYDSSLRETLDEDWIKTVFFQSEIVQWLVECMNAIPEKANTYYYLLQYKDFWRDTMSDLIIQEADKLFKGKKDQWSEFIEWSKYKDNIIGSWFLTLKEALNKCFRVDNGIDAWDFEPGPNSNNWEYYWYLKELGKNTVHISLWQETLKLIIDPHTLDLAKGKELLRTNKYDKIIGAFERSEESFLHDPKNHEVFIERGNFVFDNEPDNERIPMEKFAWYSHYETKNVVEQILRKINRFREPQITALLKELIIEIKK